MFFLGAGLGGLVHRLLMILIPTHIQAGSVGLFVLAGAASMLASNFRAALMASVLVLELTQSLEFTVLMLATTSLSTFITKLHDRD